jgi:rhodanese-related sulfurtransferase
MAVAIKKSGFHNIKIYNGGLKDWIKSGNQVESIDPLPDTKVDFMDSEELLTIIGKADKENCLDRNGHPLLTLIDLRLIQDPSTRKGADKYRIKTQCWTITALLDDFIDNTQLIQAIPKEGITVSVSETGNRDVFLIRYLSKFGRTNIHGLKYGMRNWMKADYPVERRDQTGKE